MPGSDIRTYDAHSFPSSNKKTRGVSPPLIYPFRIACTSTNAPFTYPSITYLPIGLSQENALAPPTGFARVFGGAAEAGDDDEAAAGVTAPIAAIPFSPS
jgi:hypothetical protein